MTDLHLKEPDLLLKEPRARATLGSFLRFKMKGEVVSPASFLFFLIGSWSAGRVPEAL